MTVGIMCLALFTILLILFFLARMKVRVKIYDEGIGLAVNLGIFRVFSYPNVNGKKNADVAKDEENLQAYKKPNKKRKKVRQMDATQTLRILVRILQEMKEFATNFTQKLLVEKFFIKLDIGGDDAYKVAMQYGAVYSILCSIIPITEGFLCVSDREINVYPHFDGSPSKININLVLSIRLFDLINSGTKLALASLLIWRHEKNKLKT